MGRAVSGPSRTCQGSIDGWEGVGQFVVKPSWACKTKKKVNGHCSYESLFWVFPWYHWEDLDSQETMDCSPLVGRNGTCIVSADRGTRVVWHLRGQDDWAAPSVYVKVLLRETGLWASGLERSCSLCEGASHNQLGTNGAKRQRGTNSCFRRPPFLPGLRTHNSWFCNSCLWNSC